MYIIYWLISENYTKTYIGLTDDIRRRLKYHQSKKVKTTIDFGRFRCFRIEEVENLEQARKREKYWKSASGRKKLNITFKAIMPPSSTG